MTIISTIISRHYTVHSSDSLITRINDKSVREPIEWEKSKIIRVDAFRGIMSYWGLAWYKTPDYDVFTYDWLHNRAKLARQYKSPEEFARSVADDLNRELSKVKFANLVDSGIGIHFTAHEYTDGYWIPEFFLISNWEDVKYQRVRSSGVGISRETYYVDPDWGHNQDIAAPEFRMKVHAFLQEGRLLIYNNGDPIMYNTVANGISRAVSELSLRGALKGIDERHSLIALAQRPIEVVSAVQRDFCKEGTRLVGGRIHNLAVTSANGEYYSTSGD